jgi:hypothetical protein
MTPAAAQLVAEFKRICQRRGPTGRLDRPGGERHAGPAGLARAEAPIPEADIRGSGQDQGRLGAAGAAFPRRPGAGSPGPGSAIRVSRARGAMDRRDAPTRHRWRGAALGTGPARTGLPPPPPPLLPLPPLSLPPQAASPRLKATGPTDAKVKTLGLSMSSLRYGRS